jgi:hypothetical protein
MVVDLTEGPDYTICINDSDSYEVKIAKIRKGFKMYLNTVIRSQKNVSGDSTSGEVTTGITYVLQLFLYYLVELVKLETEESYEACFIEGFKVFVLLIENVRVDSDECCMSIGKSYKPFLYKLVGERKGIDLWEVFGRQNGIGCKVIMDPTFIIRLSEINKITSFDWMEKFVEDEEAKKQLSKTEVASKVMDMFKELIVVKGE